MTVRPMRIAVLGCRGIPSTYSGYETFIGELAPRLAAKGHEVTVYCRRVLFRQRPSSYRGVALRYLPSLETKNFGTLSHTLLSVLDAVFRKYDLLFFVNPGNGFHCLLPWLIGQKTAMNMNGVEWKRGKWGPIARNYFKAAARAAAFFCGEIVNDSREMQRIYLRDFKTSSVYIPYGAHIQTSRNPELLAEFGVRARQYYLVASRLAPETLPDLIAEAYSGVRTDRPLLIAGQPNYRSPLVERMRKLSDPRVRLLGHVSSPDLFRELKCNCYAYIHGHSVGGTNPSLLEILGAGGCVLAVDVPFNREVIGESGLYFEKNIEDLRQKIQFLEDNPQAVEEFRRRAPGRIREAYTWEMVADQYEHLFSKMVSRRPGISGNS